MPRLILALLLLAAPALAQTPPAPPTPPPTPLPPENICVPRALLDRITGYAVGQPWRDVAPIMGALVEIARNPVPCEPRPEGK